MYVVVIGSWCVAGVWFVMLCFGLVWCVCFVVSLDCAVLLGVFVFAIVWCI